MLEQKCCTICNSPIVRNDKVLILSYPISILDNDCNFDVFGDFFSKLTFVHYKCFLAKQKDTNTPLQRHGEINSFSKRFPEIIELLYNTLRDLGEQVHRASVERFCMDKMSTDLNYLITEYFKNKK